MNDEVLNFKVTNRDSFIKFLESLRNDLLVNKEFWENRNLEDFLEAMAAYAEDIQGFYDNTEQNIIADEPSWQVFADIFKGAISYE
jgi:hypothetical protein